MPGSNRLINETSPYLLQHAHNPVDWYPWGKEALDKAKAEDKPILVSIGYSACHWCHVMERESFERESTARIMNDHFINIKIDREERPDLDHIYMDAVQAMTGSGGWPLNVFLTPDGKPFYGGTYYPPVRSFNRASWEETLFGVIEAFRKKRAEIDAQAENLTNYLIVSNSFGTDQDADITAVFDKNNPDVIYEKCMKNADKNKGGFGRAPKFPQSFTIQYLLRYYHFTKNMQALNQARLSLDKMIQGGIYDQVGGGFARYSTDDEWLVPHFEKMLYDNALLVSVLSEAYQLTHNELYRDVIDQTIEFIRRELLSPENGFYAALDADSEGVEGKFYVWSKKEIDEIAGDESELFCSFYDVSENGNWEKSNILNVKEPLKEFAAKRGIRPDELKARLQAILKLLLKKRAERVRPGLDDKILLNWNALFNTACSKAFSATGNDKYKQLAVSNMEFMLKAFKDENGGGLFHAYKNGKARYAAFLDDYAFLIQALIQLQEITGEVDYLNKAYQLAGFVTDNFSDEDNKLFYFTHKGQKDLVVRKKEIYDGATPSANAVMAENLFYLSIVYDKKEWQERAAAMVAGITGHIKDYPSSFGVWANLLLIMIKGVNELAVIGENTDAIHRKLLHEYIPNRVLQVSEKEDENFPLLRGKSPGEEVMIYLCRNYSCKKPVNSVELLIPLLEN